MKKYSLKKAVPLLILLAGLTLLFAFSVQQLVGRGHFGALHLRHWRSDPGLGHAPFWLALGASFLPLAWLLLKTWARKGFAEFSAPGIHHYYNDDRLGAKRIHLRIEKNRDSILMIDAYRVVHLNPTATLMTKYFLDGYHEDDIGVELAQRFRVPKRRVLQNYRDTIEKIRRLITRDDICPISYFDVDKIDAFQTPVSAPYRMDLALTYRCNIACSHCYNQRRDSPELTTDLWRQILKILWDAGIPHVVFTGGEATLRDDLAELIGYAEDLGMITGLLTNGVTLADASFVDRLQRAGLDYVQFTLESADAAVHNRMVHSRSFAKTVKGIENVVARSIHVITNTTITRDNVAGIGKLVPFLKKLGVRSMAVNSIINAGRARHKDFGVSEKKLLPIVTRLRNEANRRGLKFTWYTPTRYCEFNPVENDLGVKQCTAGKYNLAIEPDGTVIPCQSFYRPLGHILRDRWSAIYESEFLESLRRRDWALDKCRQGCEWLASCGCGCPLQITQDQFCCPDLLSNP